MGLVDGLRSFFNRIECVPPLNTHPRIVNFSSNENCTSPLPATTTSDLSWSSCVLVQHSLCKFGSQVPLPCFLNRKKRFSKLGTPRAQFITSSGNQRNQHCATNALLPWWNVVTVCHIMPWISFLEPLRASVKNDSETIRTDTTLDQDCVLKTTVQLCTACMIVSLLTTCLNLNTPLAQIAPFRCKIRNLNAGVTLETKLNKHVCQQILVCATPRFQAWSAASWPFQRVEAIATARVQAQHGPDKASALYHPRASLVLKSSVSIPHLTSINSH